MKYTVIELQNGIAGDNVWTYDTEDDALAKYFSILSVAAKSSVAIHAATIIRSDGTQVASYFFDRTPKREED